jgi:formylglycine-generating enzyme required for sulfatase activity
MIQRYTILFFALLAVAGADTIVFRNGSRLTGQWLGADADQVRFLSDGTAHAYDREIVSGVIFGPDAAVAPVPIATVVGGGPRAGEVKVNPKDGLTYVWMPPGTFSMGCSPGDNECAGAEKPAHQVTISKGFWIGQTVVTQEAYQRVMGTNPSNFKGAKLPVETVKWSESQNYCQTVGMRLPTDSEWEYAARAGDARSRYGDLDRIAWSSGNSGGRTHEVAQKDPNAWGLYDMLGNVWEWTDTAQHKGLRGGSWNGAPSNVRVSNPGGVDAGDLGNFKVGFRCAGE